MIDTPTLAQIPRRHTAVIHLTIPREDMRTMMGPAHREVMAAVAAQGLVPTGPWFAHHLKMDPAIFDFEVGVPVATPVTPVGRVIAGEWPAVTMAHTVFHGSYEGLSAGWGTFNRWLAAEGHTAAPDLWESYAVGPESSREASTWRTELHRPLAR
jgi:effector-binding domain-containing protein